MTDNDMPSFQIVTPVDLSRILKRSRTTIWRWITTGKLPPAITIDGQTIGWKPSVIEQWFDEKTRG